MLYRCNAFVGIETLWLQLFAKRYVCGLSATVMHQ